jgi:hypothetical protein
VEDSGFLSLLLILEEIISISPCGYGVNYKYFTYDFYCMEVVFLSF